LQLVDLDAVNPHVHLVMQVNGVIVMEISGKNQHVQKALVDPAVVHHQVVIVLEEALEEAVVDRQPAVVKLIKMQIVKVGPLDIVRVNTSHLWQKIVPNHVVVNNEDKI